MSRTADDRPINILVSAAIEAEKRGMSAHSDKLFEKALSIEERAGLTGSIQHAAMLMQFADFCVDSGRYERAEALYRDALTIVSLTRGAEHFSAAIVMRNLADICSKLGKESEAADLNDRAVALMSRRQIS